MKEEKNTFNRRNFLKKCGVAGAVAASASAMPGCSLFHEPEMKVGTVAELEAKGYLNPEFNWAPIHTTYLNGELVTISLVCSHKRCDVEWQSDKKQFLCPCHDGLYDAEGFVLDGPPPSPLKRFKTEIRGDEIWVLNEYVKVS